MEKEKIIRQEAKSFHRDELHNSGNAKVVDDFHELQSRLFDFTSSENKAIFLDEIQKCIVVELKKHRDEHHGGVAKESCDLEKRAEKLLFYIEQEIETFPALVHQKFSSNPLHTRNKVFISYSHLDKECMVDVQRHFKPFLNQIDFWDDSKIKPGQKWKEEIKNAIEQTKVAILLVSTDFLGSEFISTDELPPLLKAAEEDGAVILIVIVKPCLFEGFPKLNQYQAMNPPSKPISRMDYDEKEELFVNLVRQTKQVLEDKKNPNILIITGNEKIITE